MPCDTLHLTILVKEASQEKRKPSQEKRKPHLSQFIQSTTSVKGFISPLIHRNSSKFGQSNTRRKWMSGITAKQTVVFQQSDSQYLIPCINKSG